MQLSNGMISNTDTPHQATKFQDTYICIKQDSKLDIHIVKVIYKIDLPNLTCKKKYHKWVKEGSMWRVIIAFKLKHTRKHEFKGYTDSLDSFLQLKQAYKLGQKFIIYLLIRSMNKSIIAKY